MGEALRESFDKYEKPITLLVEDDISNLQARTEMLTLQGFHVITATSKIQANLELKSGPAIDLLVTDVNLDDTDFHDQSGVEIARNAKLQRPTLPIIGYSGKFTTDEISREDIALFDEIYGRGQGSSDAIIKMTEDWYNLAINYRKARRDKASSEINRLQKKYDITQHDINLIRKFIPNKVENDLELSYKSAEEILFEAGYALRIMDASEEEISDGIRISQPFAVWIKRVSDSVISEPYGYSDLLGMGDTEEASIQNLLQLMCGYYQDLKNTDNNEDELPVLQLKAFLYRIFGV